MLTNATLDICTAACNNSNIELIDVNFHARKPIVEKIFSARHVGYKTCSIAHDAAEHTGALQYCEVHATFDAPYTRFRTEYDKPMFYFINPKNATELELFTFFNRIAKNSEKWKKPDRAAIIKQNGII